MVSDMNQQDNRGTSAPKLGLNLPNKLTVTRIFLVPVCMFFVLFEGLPETWSRIIAAAVFILTALTDTLDGMIARRLHLVTDFGKFLDPVADKMLVIGVLLSMLVRFRADAVFVNIMVWVVFIVFLRELGVTSLRMIVSGKANIVVAANWMGKVKTVSQMVCILTILLEPVLIHQFLDSGMLLSYVTAAFMTVMTVASGVQYFRAYWQYIRPEKQKGSLPGL